MRYKCYLCEFQTDVKSQIHKHHIIPKQCGGTNDKSNMIQLCPRCHSLIYCPTAIKGIHTFKGIHSMELIGWKMSTGRKNINL